MSGFVTGNAVSDADTRNRGGWFIGHFIPHADLRHSMDVEVKWGIHAAGDRNAGGFVTNKTATTMSVVISGHFRLLFRDDKGIHNVDLARGG